MKIVIQNNYKNLVELDDLNSRDSIEYVISRIKDELVKLKVQINDLKLYYRNLPLYETKTLYDYNIENGNYVDLVNTKKSKNGSTVIVPLVSLVPLVPVAPVVSLVPLVNQVNNKAK